MVVRIYRTFEYNFGNVIDFPKYLKILVVVDNLQISIFRFKYFYQIFFRLKDFSNILKLLFAAVTINGLKECLYKLHNETSIAIFFKFHPFEVTNEIVFIFFQM